MAAKLQLAPSLAMPLDAVTRTFGIFGQRGSGKSTTGATMVEQIVTAGGRALIFDPTGVWWGLTREGAGPGLPGVVLGGEHADAPLQPGSGSLVAEFVMASGYPLAVLDMKLLRKHERQKLAMEILEALYHDNRDPLMVVFDEAPQFAPQMMRGKGEDAVVPRLLGAVEDVVSLGRSRGLGATLIAQRLAMVNTNVREQVETLISHRLMGTNDRKALRGWIEAQADPEREKEVMEQIAKLPDGSALVWSPSFLDYFGVVAMNNATTFDSRATPKIGQRVQKPGKRAHVDLDTLRDRMAETIERVKENDPAELRKRIRDLEQKLKDAPRVDEGRETELLERIRELEARKPERIEIPVFADKQIERLETVAARVYEEAAALGKVSVEMRAEVIEALSKVPTAAEFVPLQSLPAAPPHQRPTPQRETPPATRRSGSEAANANGATGGENSSVSEPQQKLLDALRWFESVGIAAPKKVVIAAVAGVSAKSSGYRNNVSRLSAAGLVSYPIPGRVQLTEEGRAQSNEPLIGGTMQDLQNAVLRMVSKPQGDLLSVLIAAYPDAVDRETLAARAGVSVLSSGFRNNVSRLSSFEMLTYPESGLVRAAPLLFLEDA